MASVDSSVSFGVKRLTRGTTIREASIARAPAVIGDVNFRNIFASVMPMPMMKLAHTEIFVVFFQ